MTYLHTPPYHTGSLPTLRLSPLPISTGSQLDHYAYGFKTNFIRAPYENTHRLNTARLQWPESPRSRAGDNPYGRTKGKKNAPCRTRPGEAKQGAMLLMQRNVIQSPGFVQILFLPR